MRMLTDVLDETRAKLAAAEDTLARAEQRIADLEQERDEARAIVGACDDAARGITVSEFMASFVPVRQVIDLRAEVEAERSARQAAEQERDAVSGCNGNCACVIGSRHFWHNSFCEEREAKLAAEARVRALETHIQRFVERLREDAEDLHDAHEAIIDVEASYRAQGRSLAYTQCADELEAALTASSTPTPTDDDQCRCGHALGQHTITECGICDCARFTFPASSIPTPEKEG